jgi:hypothetical protein
MEKKSQSDYWKEFYPIWGEGIKSWFGWGGWRKTMTSLVISIGIVYAFIYFNKIEIAVENILQLGFACLVGLIWFIVIAVVTFVSGNIKLYDKKINDYNNLKNNMGREIQIKDEKIKELNNKLEVDNPFIFSVAPSYLYNGITWVGIDIFNNSLRVLTCSATVQTERMSKPDVLYYLRLGSPSDEVSFEIPRKSNVTFYLACAGVGKDWPCAILNTNSDMSRRIYQGEYELSITILGEDTDKKFVEGFDKFILSYQGDDKLMLRKK